MSKNILEILLGSHLRVKILRFLFRNYPVTFSIRELSSRIQERSNVVSKEIKLLRKIGLIKVK